MTSGEVNSIFRVNWRRYWLQQIHDLSDADLQRREWLNSKQANPHWSYIEFMCSYFDDLHLSEGGYAKAVADHLVTEEESGIVTRLHEFLETHAPPNGDDYDNKGVLDDPNWIAIIEEAQSAKGLLMTLLDDPVEKRILEFGK